MNRLRKNVIFSASLRCALVCGSEEVLFFCDLTARVKRLRKKPLLWRSSRFAGCALACGSKELLFSNDLTAQRKLCPSERFTEIDFFCSL